MAGQYAIGADQRIFSEAEQSEPVALGVTELLPKPLSYAEVARSIAAALGKPADSI